MDDNVLYHPRNPDRGATEIFARKDRLLILKLKFLIQVRNDSE